MTSISLFNFELVNNALYCNFGQIIIAGYLEDKNLHKELNSTFKITLSFPWNVVIMVLSYANNDVNLEKLPENWEY